MKRSLLMLLFIVMGVSLMAQTVVFSEDFESGANGVTSSSTGATSWGLSSRIVDNGVYADSAKSVPGDTLYLTTNSFSTVGNSYVVLEFSHIAKVGMTDAAKIEYSTDNGATWTVVTLNEYNGTGIFTNNKFNAVSYPAKWDPANAATIHDSMFVHESFNVSALGNTANAKLRFALIGGVSPLSGDGWFIDDIEVIMSPSELIPPTVALIPALIPDTVNTSGPFTVNATASDASGIDNVKIYYTTSDGVSGVVGMTEILTDTFQGDIPFPGFGRSVSYYVKATDASGASNIDSTITKTFYCKYNAVPEAIIGNCGGTTSNMPIYISSTTSSYKYSQSIMLYTPAEISLTGLIEKIAWLKDDATGYTHGDATLDIYMKHSSATSVTTTSGTFATELTGATLVYSSTSQNLNTAAGWQEFVLSTAFDFNGTDNLMVLVDWYRPNAATAGYPDWCYTAATGMAYCWNGASANPTYGTTSGSRPDTKFSFPIVPLSLDAGIEGLNNLSTSVTANTSLPIECDLKNFGTTDLTSVTINWTIDGVAQTPVNWTGTLAADASTVVSLGNANLSIGSHTIEVCTDMPNATADLNYGNDCFDFTLYACSSLLSGVYTIDPAGTGASNFVSFSEAVFALNQCGVNGPVTMNVASGTYTEQISLGTINGVSSTNTVTFQSTAGDSSAVVMAFEASNAYDNYVVELDGSSFIRFKDMTLKALDTSYARVLSLNNSTFENEFDNVVFEGINYGVTGIGQDLITSAVSSNDSLITFDNCFFKDGYHGINFYGKSAKLLDGIVISNSVFKNQNEHFIRFEYVDAPVISNNIFDADSTISMDGIYFKHVKNVWRFEGNSVSQKMGGKNLQIWNCNSAAGAEALVANNMFYVGGISAHLIDFANGTHVQFVNNTFKYNGAGGNTFHINDYLGTTDSVYFYNNIFANMSDDLAFKNSAGSVAIFMDYNNYYVTGTDMVDWDGDIATDLTALTALSTQDTHSLNVDPYFLGTFDLHVANNLLNAAAIPFAGVTTDIDGEARDASTPDIGADEFVPSPNDVAVLEILSPISDCGLDTADVIVRIKNVGSADISGNFTMSYEVFGAPAAVSEAVTTTIPAGTVYDFTFSQYVVMDGTTLGQDSVFKLTVWGDLTGDNVPFNDTVKSNVFSGYVPPVPTVTNASTDYNTIDTLYAQSNDALVWFENDTTDVELARDTAFITPIMYFDRDYYVASQASAGNTDAFIGNAASTSTSYSIPYGGNWKYAWSRIIYDAAEIGVGGRIDSVSFYIGNTPSNYVTTNQKIYMAHTTMQAHPNTDYVDPTTISGAVLVYDATITYNNTGKFTIHFSTPFEYNGTDNLLIHWENHDGNYSSGYPMYTYTSISDKVIYKRSDQGFPAVSGSTSTNRPNIEFHVLALGCMSERVPLHVTVTNAPTDDVSVTQIINPVDGIELTNAEAVTIEVTNNALDTQDTIPVGYTVDGGAAVIDTLFYSLVNGASTTFTFATPLDLSAFADYDLKVFTLLDNDFNTANDTLQDSITCAPLTYCISSATNTADDDIGNVTFAGINNTSPSPYSSTYTDYTTTVTPAVVLPGNTYPISIEIVFDGSTYDGYCEAYIDFNHDGVFDEPSELIFGDVYLGHSVLTGNVTIPPSALEGTHRMRVVARYSSDAAGVTPCGTYSYGETEDYMVTVLPRIPEDAGVVELLNVTDTTFEASTVVPHAVVFNFGTDTIQSVDVKYSINNGTVVTATHVGDIYPLEQDTVVLSSFTSPAGYYSICLYTELAGDSSNTNDTLCETRYGMPTKDAVAFEILPLDEYCGMTTDTIMVRLTNIGVDTINATTQTATTTISYQSNNAPVVTETMNLVVAPGDTVLYEFAAHVDVSTNNFVDSIYNIKAWIDFVGDNVQINDTATTMVTSMHVPLTPNVVSPLTLAYGSPATLNATSADTVVWFADDVTTNTMGQGEVHVTPYLYDTDTFYASSRTGGPSVVETIGDGTNTSQPLPMNMYFGYSYSQTIYTAAEFNGNFGMIDKIAYYFNGNASNGPDDIVIYMGTTSKNEFTSNTDWIDVNTMSVVYDGTISTTAFAGWIEITLDQPFVYDGSENLVVAFDENTAGFYTSSDDFHAMSVSDDRSITKNSDSSNPDPLSPPSGSLYSYIPNTQFTVSPIGCMSARVPVIVNIDPQTATDVGVIAFVEPTDGIFKSSTEAVTVKVKNFGSADATNVPVYIQFENGTPVMETITATIPANDTIDFTFAATADMHIMDSLYTFKAWTALTGDANALNDTTVHTALHEIPAYCPSGANYTNYTEIVNVSVGNQFSNSSVADGSQYTDFTGLTNRALVQINVPTSISVTTANPPSSSSTSSGYIEVYIDLNRDGIFDETNESIFDGASPAAGLTDGTFIIPDTTLPGITAMRVVKEHYASSTTSVNACGSYSYGETEDYLIYIAPKIPEDAGVEAIIEPGIITDVTNPNLVLRVRNYGTQDITSVDLTYVLNGVPTTTTYTATTIATSDYVDVDMGAITLQNGSNTISAYTTLSALDTNNFNDTAWATTYLETVVSAPYSDDFENSNIWFNDTLNNQWEYGTPAGDTIHSAHSGTKAYVTRLDTTYDAQIKAGGDFLYSPKIITSGLDSGYVKFWHQMNVDDSDDFGTLQASVNNGSFAPVGTMNDLNGVNWYNKDISGVHAWAYANQDWQQSSYKVDFLDQYGPFFQADTVQFRFAFYGDGSSSREGWAIDDFELSVPMVPVDAGVVAITSPTTSTAVGSTVNITVTIKNYGLNALATIPVSYTVNGGGTVNETIDLSASPLASLATTTYTFTTPLTGPLNDYIVCVRTDVIGDGYPQNDNKCTNTITATPGQIDAACRVVWPTATTSMDYNPPVFIKIYNKGTDVLTSIPVQYTVPTKTVNETWTGTLNPGDSVQYQFTETYISSLGNYQLCAETQAVNDANPLDNENCVNLVGTVTGIEDADANNFVLHQNQPNPVENDYSVRYDLPKSGDVRFELRNSLGQLIQVEEIASVKGSNTLKLNANGLGAGVYFYSVEFDGTRKTMRLVIAK